MTKKDDWKKGLTKKQVSDAKKRGRRWSDIADRVGIGKKSNRRGKKPKG